MPVVTAFSLSGSEVQIAALSLRIPAQFLPSSRRSHRGVFEQKEACCALSDLPACSSLWTDCLACTQRWLLKGYMAREVCAGGERARFPCHCLSAWLWQDLLVPSSNHEQGQAALACPRTTLLTFLGGLGTLWISGGNFSEDVRVIHHDPGPCCHFSHLHPGMPAGVAAALKGRHIGPVGLSCPGL